MRRMLDDIAREVQLTREMTGRDALSARVLAAMAEVPRERFVPEPLRRLAYENGPLPIGHGQTISQPFMVALMTELLLPDPDADVLEVGAGSGYQAAVLSRLVRRVYTVEILAALAHEATARWSELGYNNVEVRVGDGYQGWPEHAPYDGIIVTAAVNHVPPALVEQLKPGGRLVIPVGEPYFGQDLLVLTKNAQGYLETRNVLPVAFVPLVHL